MNKVFLKAGREKNLKQHHPWVYSGAIARVEGKVENGETVEVYSHSGELLALAAISPGSQLALRVWTFEVNKAVDLRDLANLAKPAVKPRGF